MAKISQVISSLLEIQSYIGDREVVLRDVDSADIPLPDAEGLGVDVIDDNPADDEPLKWWNGIHSRN